MSRGGFRGRGRGGGGPGRDIPIAGLTRQELADAMSNIRSIKHSGVLYPPLDNGSTSHLPMPTDHETLIMEHTISLNSTLSTGKGASVSGSGHDVGAGVPPWRLVGERKVVGIEIESYSDRFNPPSSKSNQSSNTKIDIDLLHLDPSMFPPALWSEYFDENNENQKEKARLKKIKKRKRIDDLDKGDDLEGEESPPPTSDEDFDFDDDDESDDHGDYDHNYFDNGEGDDDSGGDSANEGGGGFDD